VTHKEPSKEDYIFFLNPATDKRPPAYPVVGFF
jgi:hypothetical protein